MILDHISISIDPNNDPETAVYKIRAELRKEPGKQWQDGLKFVWHNSPFYLCNKSELTIEGSRIELIINNDKNLQNAIDSLSSSVLKAEKMVKSSGISYISSYRKVIN